MHIRLHNTINVCEKHKNKGVFYGECNRSACNTIPATWYNISTRMYYCEKCAAEINYWSRTDHGTTICVDHTTPQPDIRKELDEVKAIRERAATINPYLMVTVKDKKGRERKVSFKDQWRAEMAAKRRAGSE